MNLTQGKYKGLPIEEVAKKDPDYLLFVYRNSGFDGKIKNWIFENLIDIKPPKK